jgi:cysteine-rich repeat protein
MTQLVATDSGLISVSDSDSDSDSGSGTGTGTAPSACGDGELDPNELCDDGPYNGLYDHCDLDCRSLGPHCGDGLLDASMEDCDDGNHDPGDGCTADCTFPAPGLSNQKQRPGG